MNAKTIHLAEPVLKLLADDRIKVEELPEKLKINEEEVCDVLEYLKEIGAVQYTETLARGLVGMIWNKVTAKGLEIACGKRPLVDIDQNISQQIINSSIGNVVQSAGDGNTIVINNSKHYILKQMIEQDSELDSEKKKGLFNILEKFNTLKESGENALELLKIVAGISLKYVPLFFGLLS
jgi:hypothetical protein